MQAEAPEAVDLVARDRRDTSALRHRRPGGRNAPAGSACWPAGWSSAACASSRSIAAPAASGTPIAGIETEPRQDLPGHGSSRSPACSKTSSGGGCSIRRSSSGAASSAARRMSEKGDGRDHNPYGFTMWMAGGGVKPGIVVGKTDEVGLHAIEDRLHVHDIHATILHALGARSLPAHLPPSRPARTAHRQ